MVNVLEERKLFEVYGTDFEHKLVIYFHHPSLNNTNDKFYDRQFTCYEI
jgi:hypothetical protein